MEFSEILAQCMPSAPLREKTPTFGKASQVPGRLVAHMPLDSRGLCFADECWDLAEKTVIPFVRPQAEIHSLPREVGENRARTVVLLYSGVSAD